MFKFFISVKRSVIFVFYFFPIVVTFEICSFKSVVLCLFLFFCIYLVLNCDSVTLLPTKYTTKNLNLVLTEWTGLLLFQLTPLFTTLI